MDKILNKVLDKRVLDFVEHKRGCSCWNDKRRLDLYGEGSWYHFHISSCDCGLTAIMADQGVPKVSLSGWGEGNA